MTSTFSLTKSVAISAERSLRPSAQRRSILMVRSSIQPSSRSRCAREAQADKFFKECIEIADTATQENCNVARLRVDTRKWAAARLAPKKYGDHIRHDVKGGTNVNFQPQILIQCSSDEEEGFIDVRAAPEATGSLPQQGNGNLVRGR